MSDCRLPKIYRCTPQQASPLPPDMGRNHREYFLVSCRSWLPGSSDFLTVQRADIPDRVALLPYPCTRRNNSSLPARVLANRESHWAEPRALPILESRRSQRPPDDLSKYHSGSSSLTQIAAGEISNRKLGRTEKISGTTKRTGSLKWAWKQRGCVDMSELWMNTFTDVVVA